MGTEIGQIFNAWSEVDYIGYKSMTKDTDWCNLIRQKINNLYTRYFDKDVILKKDYMDLLKTPYNLYYRWIKGVGFDANIDDLISVIESSIHKAEDLKITYQKQKMELPWEEYKIVVEGFLQKIFSNCKPIEEYEINNLTNKYIYELASEDNSYIKYFCDNLEGEMLKWQKKYYGVKEHKRYTRCKECGALIEKSGNKKTYCNECATKRKKESNKKSDKKYRENRNNRVQPKF